MLEKIVENAATLESSGEKEREIFALITWDKTYSSEDSESLCSAIKRFNSDHPKSKIFFDAPKECNITAHPDSYNSAQLGKYGINAGAYFTTCTAVCAGCIGAADFGLNLASMAIPVLAPFAWARTGKDILDNCVLGCGIPSAVYFLGNIDDLPEDGLKAIYAKPLNAIKDVADLTNEWVTATMTTLTTSIFTSRRMVAATKDATGVNRLLPTAPVIDPLNSINMPAVGGGTPRVVAWPPRGLTVDQFNRQLTNLHNVAANPPLSNAAYASTGLFAPANALDGTDLAAILTRISTPSGPPNPPFVVNVGAINSLTPAELSRFSEIMRNGSFGIHGGAPVGSFIPNAATMANGLENYNFDRHAVIPGNPINPARVAKTIELADYGALRTTLDDSITGANTQINNLNTEIARLQARNAADPRIAELVTTRNGLTTYKGKLQELLDITNRATVRTVGTPPPPRTVYEIADVDVPRFDTIRGPSGDALINDVEAITTKASNRNAKITNGIVGFVKGALCTALGNIKGISTLDSVGKSGQLSNSIMFLATDGSYKFNNYTIYKAVIGLKDSNSSSSSALAVLGGDSNSSKESKYYVTITSSDLTIKQNAKFYNCSVDVQELLAKKEADEKASAKAAEEKEKSKETEKKK
ncbi:MAG: hypothetical protein V1824_04035 [archaeon]